jgi:hypothetical protein
MELDTCMQDVQQELGVTLEYSVEVERDIGECHVGRVPGEFETFEHEVETRGAMITMASYVLDGVRVALPLRDPIRYDPKEMGIKMLNDMLRRRFGKINFGENVLSDPHAF